MSNGKKAVYSYFRHGKDENSGRHSRLVETIDSPDIPHTHFSYDKTSNRLTKAAYPDGRYLKVRYDEHGHVKELLAPLEKHGEEKNRVL